MFGLAGAQGLAGSNASFGPPERSITEWLVRLQQASRVPSYVGTFVVLPASGAMSSSRIWHVCEGDTQLERVETLTGEPRIVYRHNDAVVTFVPEARTVRTEQRESGGVFPNLLKPGDDFKAADFYSARQMGQGRVAGFDADIVVLAPRDELRFGYRIWSERRTGLVIKTQTLDGGGRVLEQAAFSELQFDAPVHGGRLMKMMAETEGFRIEKPDRARTTAAAEGWELKAPVPGFRSQNFYRRPSTGAPATAQWIFSDGLATVSLFMEPFSRQRHGHEGVSVIGATHTLTRRLADKGSEWWVTAVGEVPAGTLKAFADNLARRK